MVKEALANLTLLVTSEDIVTTITSSHLLKTVIFPLLTFYFGIQLYRRNKPKRDFDSIPQPSWITILGTLREVAINPGLDSFKVLESYVKQYGKIIKLTIFFEDLCLLCDPSHVQKLLSSTNPGHLNKPKKIYDMVGGDNIKHGLICADYPTWKPHRKVISRLFTTSGIQHQLTAMNKHVKEFVTDVQFMLNNSNGNCDVFCEGKLGEMIDFTALKNIFHIIMDREMVTAEEINKFHTNFLTVKAGVSKRIRQPWLLLDWIWAFHPLRRTVLQASKECRQIVCRVVEKYRETMKNNLPTNNWNEKQTENEYEDIGIKPFKCIMEEMLETAFNDEDIYHEASTMIAAGHETTSSSIRFMLFRLALNPDIQQKCRKEVDAVFDEKLKNTGQSSSSGDFTMQDLNNLEYLDRCVKENLRLAPIGPLFGRRLDTPLKLEENLELPAKLQIGICPWVLHRLPEYFPDPEKFDPDRFLPEECAKRHPYAYLPFSAGPRICIGSKVAYLSIKLMTAFILRHFVVETTDRWEDLEFVYDISLTTKKEFNLSLKKRLETF